MSSRDLQDPTIIVDDETEEPETFENKKKLRRKKLLMRKTNVETHKENEEEGWNTPNKTCEKEEGDERVKAEEKDDYKEDAKEQSNYTPAKKQKEAVDWTIESVEIT